MGPMRVRDVAVAQQEMLGLARKLEAEGKLVLMSEKEDDFMV